MNPVSIDSGRVFRSGRNLVATLGAELPQVCIKCGAPLSESIRKRFAWHHPGLYFLILVNLLVYALVAYFVQKRMELRVPVCSVHADRYHKNRLAGILLLVGAIPTLIVFAVILPDSIGWSILLCIAMLLGGGILLASTNLLRPTRIAETHGIFSGAAEAFLGNLEEAPERIEVRTVRPLR